MRIICIQINESEQMRSFFFIFFLPPLPSTRQSSHPADLISTGRTAAARSRNWLVVTGASLLEWWANGGGTANAPRRVGYEHVGDAINAIKFKRGLSVTRQELWSDQWEKLTEHQSSSVGKGKATSDSSMIGPF